MSEMQVPGYQSELQMSDISPDFDKIALSTDPELIGRLLDGERLKKNIMSTTEFSKYAVLFQNNGVDTLGEREYRELMNEYVSKISIYDPVTIMEGDKVAIVLPPIFKSFNVLNMAGSVGADINQAFINACNADDPMSQMRMDKYADYYKKVVSIANPDDEQNKAIAEAMEITNKAMEAVQNQQEKKKTEEEIRDLDRSHFKDSEVVSLSDETRNNDNGDDEFEPL